MIDEPYEPTDEEFAELIERKREQYKALEENDSDLQRMMPPPTPVAVRTKETNCERCGGSLTERLHIWHGTAAKIVGEESTWVQQECETCLQQSDLEIWEREQREKRLAQLRNSSELPGRLAKMDLDAFDANVSDCARDALGVARDYVRSYDTNSEGRGIVFFGGPGTGKTHLAVGIMRELIASGVPSLFVTIPTLLQNLRDAFRTDEVDANWLRRAKEAELLLLDDLGAHKGSEWADEIIFVIVNHRYAAGLPTIITTNLSPPELTESIGKRAVSRLVEMCDWIHLEGADHRWSEWR